MNVTRDWVRQQAAKATAPVVEGWRDGVLTVWVPGRPANPMNGSRGHWSKHARWAKGWRERAGTHLLPFLGRFSYGRTLWLPETPKAITLTIYAPGRGFDDDAWGPICKPLRDALKDMRIIDDDGNNPDGTPRHAITYAQVTKAPVVGIAVRIARK